MTEYHKDYNSWHAVLFVDRYSAIMLQDNRFHRWRRCHGNDVRCHENQAGEFSSSQRSRVHQQVPVHTVQVYSTSRPLGGLRKD